MLTNLVTVFFVVFSCVVCYIIGYCFWSHVIFNTLMWSVVMCPIVILNIIICNNFMWFIVM